MGARTEQIQTKMVTERLDLLIAEQKKTNELLAAMHADYRAMSGGIVRDT